MKSNICRKMIRSIAIAGGLCIALVPALRAETAPDRVVEQYKAWTLTCASSTADSATPALQRNCVMEQAVRDSKSGATVMQFLIAADRDAPAPTGTIVGPFGVDLAQGLDLSVDGAAAGKIAFRTCLQAGCIADMVLDEARIATFRDGTTLVVTVRPSDNPTSEIDLSFSLNGFGDALTRLQSAMGAAGP